MAVSVKDFLDAVRGRFNDEPNKVEVTGSNVEIKHVLDVEVTAGATSVVSDTLNVSGYTFLYTIIHVNEQHSYVYTHNVRRSWSDSGINLLDIEDYEFSGAAGKVSKPFRPMTTQCRMAITNNDSEDRIYNISLIGLKG